MARKRYSDEDMLKLLREIDVHLHDGLDIVNACRKAGISDNGFVRPIRTRLCMDSRAVLYAAPTWRHSARAALQLSLKLARE
jgi:hypothetical protein